MPYDVTTIGGLFGSCACGKDKSLDLAKMAGIADTASSILEKLNPFSDQFLPYDLGRRAGAAAEQKLEAVADPLPTGLELVGIPTWGYERNLIMGMGLAALVGAGALVVVRRAKKKGKAR